MKRLAISWALLPAAAALLVACGGGGGGGGATASSVSGIVAVGAALPNAAVVLIDAQGTTRAVTSDTEGRYQIDTTGLQAPFVVRAAGSIGAQEFSLVSLLPSQTEGQSQTVQITPLTTAIAGLVNAANAYDVDGLMPSQVTTSKVNAAKEQLVFALQDPIRAAGLDSTFDPISQTFTTNRRGPDQVLDVVDVRLRPEGVVLSNRMEVLDSNSDPRNLVLASTGIQSGSWPSGVNPVGDALNNLERKIKNCFALPASERAGPAQTDSGGVVSVSSGSIAPLCKNFVVDAYQNNTHTYAERWGWFLSSSDFLNANVIVNLRYVQRVDNGIADNIAYIVNINIKDVNGNWYTRPEVLEKTVVDGQDSFKLFGNRRQMDFSIDSTVSYIDDLANPLNSRVEGRLQFNAPPHRAKLTSGNSYQYFYEPNSSRAEPKIICAWVTGPMLQTGAVHDVNAPKGGILLKIPHPEIVQSRTFMAIHAKYSQGFDPVNDLNHRDVLKTDCSNAESAPSARISTIGTNNQFTFSAAKATSAATWTYPSINQGNLAVTDQNVGTCVQGNCARRSYVNSRSSQVTATDQSDYVALYGSTAMPRFTVYAFQLDGFTDGQISQNNQWPDIESFWNSKKVAHIRMVGSMPFILKDAAGSYADIIKFRKPNIDSINKYLSESTVTMGVDDVLTMGWDVPAGAQGIDRFGGKAQAYYLNNSGQERIINSSISQFSRSAPRSVSTGSIKLTDQWLGTDMIGQTYPNSLKITAVQRELWVRSYDTENRQIQYVYLRKVNQSAP